MLSNHKNQRSSLIQWFLSYAYWQSCVYFELLLHDCFSCCLFPYSWVLHIPEFLPFTPFWRQARLLLPTTALQESFPSTGFLLWLCLWLEHAQICKLTWIVSNWIIHVLVPSCHLILWSQCFQYNKANLKILSIRVPVGQPKMGTGRGGREMRGMSGLVDPPGDLQREASPQVPTLGLPTESGMGRSRPSLTLPHGSSSLVSFMVNCCQIEVEF